VGYVVSTDPPYYDNVGYSDLSDFYYVWLRRALSSWVPGLFNTVATPKTDELIASAYRFNGDRDRAMKFFEIGLSRAFGRMLRAQASSIPLALYYAFKQAEVEEDDDDDNDRAKHFSIASTGWETMLEGLVGTGFSVMGTWPMRTEQTAALKNTTNVLASSIVLVCRPRLADASVTTRKDFLAALKRELPAAMRDLQSGNIAPVDLAQAAIGPGMAVFSRYAKVLEFDNSPMRVRTALALINQALDEVLTEQEAEFDADTRWALAWFEQHAHDEGLYGNAETLSKAKNVSVRGLEESGILEAKGGKVRLLGRDELNGLWDPTTDSRLTVWEVTQHLIRKLDQDGESGAAELLRKLGGLGEVARDLAYRLYTTCERKKWAQEALAYNSLVVAWPEISRMARQSAPAGPSQITMFES
jgi:putative DNA methylase